MHEDNHRRLDRYLTIVDANVRTTRRASEVFFDMPPVDDAIEAERLMRTTLNETFEGVATDDPKERLYPNTSFEDIKAYYWDMASRVTEISGAKCTATIEDYLHVMQDRDDITIRDKVRSEYPPQSPACRLLDGVEAYSHELGLDIMTASRFATAHLKAQLPYMRSRASYLVAANDMTDVEATQEVFREFSEVLIPAHIHNKLQEPAKSSVLHGFLGTIPKYKQGDIESSAPLRMTRSDARGLAAVYKLERRPYDASELAYAERLAQEPIIQSVLLLFQMAIVDYSRDYLLQHPERMQHSLLPFSEFFVLIERGELVPNPKLIQVLNNNYLPALAGIVLKDDIAIRDITPIHFSEAALEARKRRVFFAQIAKFNNYDPNKDTVDLDVLLNRTCPAMQVLTSSMEDWLPKIYEHLQVSVSDVGDSF